MEGEREREKGHHKNIKGVKTIRLPFFVGNGPEPNKDSLMDIFDRRLWKRNSLVSSLSHVWLVSGGEY